MTIVKAFAKALIDHLKDNKGNYTHTEYGAGGCDTCNYGADEYDVLNLDDLEQQSDNFSKQFEA